MLSLLQNYSLNDSFDEMFQAGASPRPEYLRLAEFLKQLPKNEFQKRTQLAELSLRMRGVTYTVYGDSQGIEKILPFDILPRILKAKEWEVLSKGLSQRVLALNAFLHDIYHDQKILKTSLLPPEIILKSPLYQQKMKGVRVPADVYVHISGIDLIRDEEGVFYVLEDNLRCPSGVSYLLENRENLQKVMPELFSIYGVRPVATYPHDLLITLQSFVPNETYPTAVLLTPGIYNSAYFEHAFLASEMGIPLVEGNDIVVKNKKVFMKTTGGLTPVHVIYRRVDDEFLDSKAFRKDSMLGVAGLFEAYTAGNVVLANAIGNGVADDKAVYPYVSKMIEFYLQEEPLLPSLKTYHLDRPEECEYVLDNLPKMVVKTAWGSGGYGMLMGSQSTSSERDAFVKKIRENPRGYIAQRIVSFSSHPAYISETKSLEPRRVDLRPYVLMDAEKRVRIVPGGLTRVALVRDSLVVNSSQGGGGKDTWVLSEEED